METPEYRVTVLCSCGRTHSYEEWQRCPMALVPGKSSHGGDLHAWRNTMTVIDLGAHERMTVEQALAVAAREKWTHVIICGFQDGDEKLCVRSSHMSREFGLWIAMHLVDYVRGKS